MTDRVEYIFQFFKKNFAISTAFTPLYINIKQITTKTLTIEL